MLSARLWEIDENLCRAELTGRGTPDPHAPDEAAREYAPSLANSEAYQQSGADRKKIETLVGEVKCHFGLTRLRLRDLSGAHDAFLLAATTQNLKRLVWHVGIPPPPHPMTA